jgi:hypothetical protein
VYLLQRYFPIMSFILLLLGIVVSVAAQGTHYLYGPQWGWYSVKGTSEYILSAETTLKPGAPPSNAKPRLALWPGMNTAMGLIQPIIVSTDEAVFQGRYVLPLNNMGKRSSARWFKALRMSLVLVEERRPHNGASLRA